MKVALILTDRFSDRWEQNLLRCFPGLQLDVWPDLPNKEDYRAAIVWKPPPGLLAAMPRLELVCCIGAGVDHLLAELPQHVRLTRVVDNQLADSMSRYLIQALLNFQRPYETYRKNQAEGIWMKADPVESPLSIGVLGLGALGKDAAMKMHQLGYEVSGWSRSPKKLHGIHSYTGNEGLERMLPGVNVLICLLPLTDETEGILNLSLFGKLPWGSLLINVARGGHLVEQDLTTALDKGYLSAAVLDVFREEPLPPAHPFWKDERIFITPHVASVTDPESAALQIAENLRAFAHGEPLLHEVKRQRGY
jgi:glyoxylate/hydroxypyruvate reductase A